MSLTALQVMQDAPVIPVIVLHDVAHAVPLAQALIAGGIRTLEITMRTPVALDCMRAICAEVPQAIVGAGTVCSTRDLDACLAAGARFAVSPGYTTQLGVDCRKRDVPLLPGVATASEIMLAQNDGYTALKFFPALQAGGVGMLKALYGPFAQIQFCPTGGLTAQNAAEFLVLPNVVCVGGSWLVPADALLSADYARIETLARQAVQLAR
ncbi:MAG: bifunctional 4-hydroxy-2-oxoglutarate aldolase/2-dehydro-3-deoxy-phosphogluconate aldolase [Alcaligenaceae bacterium]